MNIHHDSGTSDGQLFNEKSVDPLGEFPFPYDGARKRCTVGGTIQEVEEVDAKGSTHDRSLGAYSAGRGNSPFPCFGSSEDIAKRVCGISFEAKREWRGTPPLDWLWAGDWWETKEVDAVVPKVLGRDEIPAVGSDGMSLNG